MSENKFCRFEENKIVITLPIGPEQEPEYEEWRKNYNPIYLAGTTLAPLLSLIADLANSIKLKQILKELSERAEKEDFD